MSEEKRPLEEIKDVMVIEDETDVSETLEMYLNNMDCFRNIIHSYDGTTAINKLANQTFSLILIDLNIPRRSGLDVLKYIADHELQNPENRKVIKPDESLKKLLGIEDGDEVTYFNSTVSFFVYSSFSGCLGMLNVNVVLPIPVMV